MVGLYVLTRSQVFVSPRLVLRPPRPAHFRPPRPLVLSHAPRRPFASRPPPARPALLSRLVPQSFRPSPGSGSSLRKVVALAKPERKPLFLAICLLLVSSSVAMTIPLTVGKLIDFFSADDPVSALVCPVVATSTRTRSIYHMGSRCTRHRAYSSWRLRPVRPALPPDRSSCAYLVCPCPLCRTESLTLVRIEVNGSSLGCANAPTKPLSAKKSSLSKKARATC
jgi:hypothetical protein